MPQTRSPARGYACTPYLHDHGSIELKDAWSRSKNIGGMYFVTATFSPDSKPYFVPSANHYLLAEFRDGRRIPGEMEGRRQEKASFVFSVEEGLFERDLGGGVSFVSVYYLEYGSSEGDVAEVAAAVAKREKVGRAGIGRMDTYSSAPSRFTFPFSESIVVLEVASEKSHQSVNKYCEKTRRDVTRKGITMTGLVGLSVLEKLK